MTDTPSPFSSRVSGLSVLALRERIALDLRDFFIAATGEARESAYAALLTLPPEKIGVSPAPPPRTKAERQALEYEFNRLFVGPGRVQAPPYASIYLDPEPQLMGRTTDDIRELMRAVGLSLRDQGREPEDHLSFELELWCVLARLEAQYAATPEVLQEIRDARRRFVREHLALWIPDFLQRAGQGEHPILRTVLQCLEWWLSTCSKEET